MRYKIFYSDIMDADGSDLYIMTNENGYIIAEFNVYINHSEEQANIQIKNHCHKPNYSMHIANVEDVTYLPPDAVDKLLSDYFDYIFENKILKM